MKTSDLPNGWAPIRDVAGRSRLFATRPLLLVTLIAPLLALGCAPSTSAPGNPAFGTDAGGSGQTGDGGAQGSANSQACQVMSGPFTAVTGVYPYTYANLGPPIQSRQAYRVSLPGPTRPGHVSFKVSTAGEYVIFVSRALPITVLTWDGTAVTSQSVASSIPECTQVKTRQTFNLVPDPTTSKETHVIRLGGDSSADVDVVFTQGP